MKHAAAIVLAVLIIAASLFAEYRIIMTNMEPRVEDDVILVEVFGQVDCYEVG